MTTQSLSLVCSQPDSYFRRFSPRITATKCDDISCSEVIRALKLEDDPELEQIEAEIEQCQDETAEWKEKKEEAENNARGMTESIL